MRVEERESTSNRCAFCHDRLAGAWVECPSCATRLHRECVAEKCPTLGCVHAFEPAVVQVPGRARRPTGLGAAASLFFGALVPFVAFAANEARVADVLFHNLRGLWVLYLPEAQRAFYPVLAWAIAAYVAGWKGRRGAWIRVGLWGGVLLALAFGVLYAPALPAALIGIVVAGIGLLGFTPYSTLVAYVRAVLRYERATPTDVKGERARDRGTFVLAAVWVMLVAGGAAATVARLPWLEEVAPFLGPRHW